MKQVLAVFLCIDIFIAQDINNIVTHPASIKVSARDRVKTDKRDSLKMAKQLSNGELKGINVPSEEREQFRILTRTRDQLAEHRKRISNQIKSLLFTQGLIDLQDDTRVGEGWLKKIQRFEMPEELKYSINLFIQIWLDLDSKLKEILKKLGEQAKKDSIDIMYRSVPGIGALSARILANELGDMSHFYNEKGLFSYTGLTPSEYSSGEHKCLGSISRQGKAVLRMLLVQIAWKSIKQDRRLLEIFERISKKAGKKRAIVAIARKIIGCIRACFKTGALWCANAPVNKEFLNTKVEAC
ncbi:MAG: Transposase IS116/IS110/IS902 family protein [uncultured bacterium]|nr:MAG: Transposase IS116/IS110/IS902 family protein [uncultured bacterium]HBY55635.1 IS110 family transposase [Coxiellaceae bacterium]